tara:strand:+ start:11460 stop:13118 length:1659 start_codon:yes stop_codon:yes gene_type:complete
MSGILIYIILKIGGKNMNMQDWSKNVASIIEYAGHIFPEVEVITRELSGKITKSNYKNISIRSKKLASALEKHGIKQEQCVGSLALNTFRNMEMFYGISGMGAIMHTINFRLHPEQIVYIINHAENKLIFIEPVFAPLLEAIQDKLPTVEKYVVLCSKEEMQESKLKDAVSYEEFIADGDEEFVWPDLKDDAPCGLCYTSGTTGNPKGVLYSHQSTLLHAWAGSSANGLGLKKEDSILMVVPMFHVNGWGLPYLAPMNGIKLVLPGMGMDGAALTELIQNENVTFAFGVPTIWLGLLNYCKENNIKLDSIKETIIGGSAVPYSMIKQFDEDHDVNVVQGWGMTETSPLATANLKTPEMEKMAKDEMYQLQTKQGKPIYGVQLKIVDDEGNRLPEDGKAFGRLLIKGPWIIKRYYKHDADAVDAEGWFDTGDISTIDADGYMTIVDRAKDVIKSGGEWISSVDLENAAVGHPEVVEACVIGVAHEKWDERPLLIVIPANKELTKESVYDFLDGKIAKWWKPDDVVFVEELPHGATGKLLKTDLREKYANHLIK